MVSTVYCHRGESRVSDGFAILGRTSPGRMRRNVSIAAQYFTRCSCCLTDRPFVPFKELLACPPPQVRRDASLRRKRRKLSGLFSPSMREHAMGNKALFQGRTDPPSPAPIGRVPTSFDLVFGTLMEQTGGRGGCKLLKTWWPGKELHSITHFYRSHCQASI